ALSETLLNVLLAPEPRAVMLVKQTTMMRASMTAYSTAVGPSSLRRKRSTRRSQMLIDLPLSVPDHDARRGRDGLFSSPEGGGSISNLDAGKGCEMGVGPREGPSSLILSGTWRPLGMTR